MHLFQLAVQCVAYRIPTMCWAMTWPLVFCVVIFIFDHSIGCERERYIDKQKQKQRNVLGNEFRNKHDAGTFSAE